MTIAITCRITYDETQSTERTHNRVLRDGLKRQAEHHLKTRYPRHFELNAQTRPGGVYKYQWRRERYLKRKATMVGRAKALIPLVLTGRLRDKVLTTAKVTGTRNGARIYAYGPAIPGANRGYITADRRAEIEIISKSEKRTISRELYRDYRREIRKPENRRKRQVRIKG